MVVLLLERYGGDEGSRPGEDVPCQLHLLRADSRPLGLGGMVARLVLGLVAHNEVAAPHRDVEPLEEIHT